MARGIYCTSGVWFMHINVLRATRVSGTKFSFGMAWPGELSIVKRTLILDMYSCKFTPFKSVLHFSIQEIMSKKMSYDIGISKLWAVFGWGHPFGVGGGLEPHLVCTKKCAFVS